MTVGTSLAPPLGTRLARVLLTVFAIVHVGLAIGPGPTPAPFTAAALIASIGAATAVVRVRGARLPTTAAAAAVVLTVGCVAIIVPWLPGDGWPGYASWPLGAATFIAIGLTLRRRIGAAWALMAVLVLVCLAWSTRGGSGVLAGLGLIERQVGVLLIGTLFAVGLQRAAQAQDALHAVQRAEELERDLGDAELLARSEAVRRVLDDAGPLLQRIADGEVLDAETRSRAAALEGRLRDEIALTPILSEPLDRALEAARLRGVDVVVLAEPDIGRLPQDVRSRAADWIAGRLDRAHGQDFVGRIVARGSGARVSATLDERTEDRLIE